jgi:hypothetical protein
MENDTPKKKRSFFDRRSGQDRRKAYSIDYFLEGGTERRTVTASERRNQERERRQDWIKIGPWSSMNLKDDDDLAPSDEEPLDIA